jgi:uncharacterized OB-fold protein
VPRRDVPTPPLVTPGTPLSDEAFRRGIAVDFAVQARYAWDAGVAIGRYLDGLKEGKILGRLCRGCRRTLVPPRMFCEECFRATDAWVEVGDTGTVQTFSLCYVTWDLQELTEPEIPAVIALDGASPGIGIMHKLGGVEPEAVRVGMRVRAVWRPAPERVGSILDIVYFAPLEAAARRAERRPPRPPGRRRAASAGTRAAAGRRGGRR